MFLECANFDKFLHGNFSKQFQVVVIAVFTVFLTFLSANILFLHKIPDYICSKLKLKKKKCGRLSKNFISDQLYISLKF